MFQKLSDTLRAKFSRKDELSRQVKIAQVLELYRNIATKILPQIPAAEIEPKSLKNKVLTVKVTSAAAASELRFYEHETLREINQTLQESLVEKIRYEF